MDADESFPVEAARDLLGILRAMYRMMRTRGAGRAELLRVERVGTKLASARRGLEASSAVAVGGASVRVHFEQDGPAPTS